VSSSRSIEVDGARLWAGVSGLAMILGAVGPWITIEVISIDREVAGFEGTIALLVGIGVLLLALAGVASTLLDVLLGLAAIVIGVRNAQEVLALDLPTIQGPGGLTISIDVDLGWGLIVLILAGVSLIACGIVRERARRQRQAAWRARARAPITSSPTLPHPAPEPSDPTTGRAARPATPTSPPRGPYGR